jgi:hypothetical protein
MTTARETATQTKALPNATGDSPPLAFGSTAVLGPLPARWYCVSREGLATLCLDEANAREMAVECATAYPRQAPYRAVQLGDVAGERNRLAADFTRRAKALSTTGAGCAPEIQAQYEAIAGELLDWAAILRA